MQTYLIALKELTTGEGDASTISSLLLETITEYGLGIECVAAFASDDAIGLLNVQVNYRLALSNSLIDQL